MSESLDDIERMFLALSDKTRIRLVGLMLNGEVTVNYLCEALGESQPKVSRHLAYLRSMEMVNTRRDGKWIYYSLSESNNRFRSRLLNDAAAWIASVTNGRASHVAETLKPEMEPPIDTQTALQNDIYAEANTFEEPVDLEVYLL